MRERDIEAYLVARVKELGGEVRKVQWVGRRAAPDRLVMLPERHKEQRPSTGGFVTRGPGRGWRPAMTVWVEVKAPGGFATFPKDERERAQFREHARLRAMDQTVIVIDSHDAVDRLLA